MKALPRRKGNFGVRVVQVFLVGASMKALPRRKGNYCLHGFQHRIRTRLNESPSKKEGKWVTPYGVKFPPSVASMKALPRRKGNSNSRRPAQSVDLPQ